jgi:hypothetical protein
MLRIPHFLDNQLADSCEVATLCTGHALLPRNIFPLETE